jgi:hypothetical protein
MREFLSLLVTCRQVYQEARLLPFSCNVWEFGEPPVPGYSHRIQPWRHWTAILDLMYDEQKSAITWISFATVYGKWGVIEPSLMEADARILASLKGLKVVIREGLPWRSAPHEGAWDFVAWFARERGCRIVDEDTIRTTGVYMATYQIRQDSVRRVCEHR